MSGDFFYQGTAGGWYFGQPYPYQPYWPSWPVLPVVPDYCMCQRCPCCGKVVRPTPFVSLTTTITNDTNTVSAGNNLSNCACETP
jgi:hypothetical protein